MIDDCTCPCHFDASGFCDDCSCAFVDNFYKQQLDVGKTRIENHKNTILDLSQKILDEKRTMKSALEHIESLINELFLHGIDVNSNDEAIAAKTFFDTALAKIELQ